NAPPGSALGVNLGVDAVQQISVQTSNYPAEYGRSSGGIISAVTRSGTNAFHGDLYEFLRNSSLDARNFFDVSRPPFRRNQFGASAGGPIQKGSTYLFGDYEGLRASQGLTSVDIVPSAAARAGNLSTGAITVDPTVFRFIDAFYPLPNGPALGGGDTGTFAFSGQQVTPENYFTARIDHDFSEQDKLSGTYMFDSGTIRQPEPLNDMRTGYDSRRQALIVDEAHAFNPGLINVLRFGISRVVVVNGLTFPIGNPSVSDTSFSAVPGYNAPSVSVPGLTSFSGGLKSISSYHFHWTSLQAYDDVSFTKGKNSLKFGFSLERMRDNILALSDPAGGFSFNSLPDFLSNRPFFLSAAIPSTLTERGLRQTIAGAYAQDDWQWHPNLTVNLGVRYEMATVPTEVQGKLSTLRRITDAQPHLGDPYFSNSTLHNFEPRVGVSWDPFRNGKTALSGGFGVFDVLPLPYQVQFNSVFSAPFFQDGNTANLPTGSFPGGAFALIAASPNTFRQAFFEPNPQRNYVMQWNFNAQRQLPNGLTLMAGYVGSRGVHQPFRVEDVDIVLPTLTSQGYLWPSPAGSGTRLNLNAGRITAEFWEADSFYDALELQLKKRISHGFQFEGSYTWGKTIDTDSSSMVGDEYSNSISSPLWFNTKINRGLSDFNVSKDLELSASWALPTPKRVTGISAWALSGWQVGGIYAASTGVPFTASFAGDALGLKSSDATLDVPNAIQSSECGSLTNPGNPVHYIKTACFAVPSPITLRGNLGRNTLVGPGLSNFDFSLFKNNHIKEFNVQLRGEFFNIFNRANFAPPLDNRALFDSSGNTIGNAGLITSTQTPSREIQLALKLIW
ncbi:MAG TPA: TonB-dependent receptor, partial [Blastocatellia bacterium]|nr:TonB-dependent receptor [Blastocatellia bacterium]